MFFSFKTSFSKYAVLFGVYRPSIYNMLLLGCIYLFTETQYKRNYINKWRASGRRRSRAGLKRQSINSYTTRASTLPQVKEEQTNSLRINIKSIGCFDPPFHGSNCGETSGLISVNGVEKSKNLPGFNFVIIDLKTGSVDQALVFDTHGEAGADQKLKDFLDSLDLWKIVCVAVKDDARTYMKDSNFDSFAKIGAKSIATQKLEVRSSYAFIGLSGPENVRSKVNWIREENSHAGDGPSVISVNVETGLEIYRSLGGTDSRSSGESVSAQQQQNPSVTIPFQQATPSQQAPTPSHQITTRTTPEISNNLKIQPSMSSHVITPGNGPNNTDVNGQHFTNVKSNTNSATNPNTLSESNTMKENETRTIVPQLSNIAGPMLNTQNMKFFDEAQNVGDLKTLSAITDNDSIKSDDPVSVSELLQGLKLLRSFLKYQALTTPNAQTRQNMPFIPTSSLSVQTPPMRRTPSLEQIEKNIEFLKTLRPSELANIVTPANPIDSLLDAARRLNGEDSTSNNVENFAGNKKSVGIERNYKTTNATPSDNSQFLVGLLDNINKIKAQLQMQLMTANSTISEELASKLTSLSKSNPAALQSGLSQISTPQNFGLSQNTISQHVNSEPASRTVDSSKNQEDSLPEDVSESSPASMEAAADAAGSRNVGESRLASALSALGLPDAGATGIASLMAAGFIAAGGKQKKEAALKLGLAAKLSKSIADLGGRGAASAAGLASLNELLKDGLDISTVRLADQIGQALQRVGGAGAAVGYAALAASLKAIGDKPKPGALVGGIILALAEQGSAPGTAGLAALAAGLGGSGADALAGGLGGTLPNVITAAQTNNYMTGGEGAPHGETSALVGGGVGVAGAASANTDAEYKGSGPIGSASQVGLCRNGICGASESRDSSNVAFIGKKGATEPSVSRSFFDSNGGIQLPSSIGGGELVSTGDNEEEPVCDVKRSVPPSCLRDCNEKRASKLGRIIDLQSSDDKAAIKVNGQDFSKDQNGFNMVVLDFNSGQVEASETFDTQLDAGAGASMKNFLSSIGDTKIILGATKGNAGEFMFNGEYRSLKDLGINKLNKLKKGDKYVFAASKGNIIPNVREEMTDLPNETAEIIMPLVVGTGKESDICQCLKGCQSNRQPTSKHHVDSEKAYADISAGDNIAGQKRHFPPSKPTVTVKIKPFLKFFRKHNTVDDSKPGVIENLDTSNLPDSNNIKDETGYIVTHHVVVPKHTGALMKKIKEKELRRRQKATRATRRTLRTTRRHSTKSISYLPSNAYKRAKKGKTGEEFDNFEENDIATTDDNDDLVVKEASLSKLNNVSYKTSINKLHWNRHPMVKADNKKKTTIRANHPSATMTAVKDKKTEDIYSSIGNSIRS